MTAPDPIEQELTLAQRAHAKGIERRRAAVVAARQLGPDGKPLKSIYRIARVLGVDERTVRAILKAAENGENQER